MVTPFLLSTDRLLLRQFQPDDAADMFALNADPEVIRYTGDVPFASEPAARQFLHDYAAYRDYGYGRWLVIEKSTGKTLGWCGLKYHPKERVTDLGYRFFQAHWGKGFAKEASRICLDYAFRTLNLEAVNAHVMPENVRSVRVLEGLGMVRQQDSSENGAPIRIYRLTNPFPLYIRPAQEADLPGLKNLYRESVLHAGPRVYTPAQVAAWASAAASGLTWERLSAQQVWVALSGDDIAGFISLKPEGYLDFLYVGANFQRQSVASRLLFLLEKDALARGLTRIETHASEVAVPFFEAKGYRVVHANLAVANGISLANFLMETTLVS